MCGICGVLHTSPIARQIDESLLVAMSATMEHRGPDDSGTFINPSHTLGFGFRRLSIIDLSPAGHQPMSTPDGSVTIVFNGEIYNHLRLRAVLESKGYRYRSRSDTETILYAYQEYGLDFVHKLLGMFAIAIWDEHQQRLILVRDRIGVKPLYYTVRDGRLIFGSEIKAILEHPAVSREMDVQAMGHYLTFLIPPAPMTMFKDIFKLEAGHMIVVGRDGSPVKSRYWDPGVTAGQPSITLEGDPVPSSPFTQHESLKRAGAASEMVRTLLKQSIKDRMMSDVPFGVFLSGGIDSSTNVALMAALMSRPVDTFSVGFRELERYNELGYARRIAKEFRTNHHEIIIDDRDAFEFLPKLIYHQDEPIADPVCIPLYFVSKLARDNGTIVIQVGEGSDEQFAGYSWMRRELRFYHTAWKAYRLLPRSIRNLLYGASEPWFQKRHSYFTLDYLRKATLNQELFWGGAINFTQPHKERLLASAPSAAHADSHALARRWHEMLLTNDPSADYLKRMIYVEFMNRLPELLLMRVDKISMATSVESRVPFLDHRLVEYSMQVPSSWKIRKGQTKAILKDAVHGLIPDEIIYRKKQGFAAPMNEWLRSGWARYVDQTLLESTLVRDGFLERDEIRELLALHRSGQRNEGQNLWNLLNLALWHAYWIERKSL
jgi:asparagine synthase (glutamine-hydrolysing)